MGDAEKHLKEEKKCHIQNQQDELKTQIKLQDLLQ